MEFITERPCLVCIMICDYMPDKSSSVLKAIDMSIFYAMLL